MSEKKKYLKLYPSKQDNWLITDFDPHNLWDGIISEMEEGDKMMVEIVEMTPQEVAELPEFQGW